MPCLDFLELELDALEGASLLRRLRTMDGAPTTEVVVDGVRAINFSSNNYLGLATATGLREAAVAAIQEEGAGAASARLIAGNLASHRALEARIAAFHGAPAALLFNSGYQANLGVLSALAGPGDVVFSDALNHASIIDGCRLSKASIAVYEHRRTADLARLLAQTPARRRFVVTESVFSMDGDVAPLADLRQLADTHDAALIVDEAHAMGALGPGGRGLAAEAGIRPDVLIATLGKAFATFGAYVAGPQRLVDFLVNRARSFVFTTALPPAVPAAARASLDLCDSSEGSRLRAALDRHIDRFAAGLRGLGLLAPASGRTPIFPVFVGDASQAMTACQRLLELGIYSQGIRPPTVPPGTARLRFSLMATHTDDQIERGLQGLATLHGERLIERTHE